MKKKYSDYQVNKAKKYKIRKDCKNNCYIVNDDNNVRIHANKFMCDCKWCSDGKLQIKYCSHILCLIYNLDKKHFDKVINE